MECHHSFTVTDRVKESRKSYFFLRTITNEDIMRARIKNQLKMRNTQPESFIFPPPL